MPPDAPSFDPKAFQEYISLLLASGFTPTTIPLVPGTKRPACVHKGLPGPFPHYPWTISRALLTGSRSGGVVVLDVDPTKGGTESLADFCRRGMIPSLGSTLLVATPSGGLHVYMDARGSRLITNAGQIATGIDLRAEGGIAVRPG